MSGDFGIDQEELLNETADLANAMGYVHKTELEALIEEYRDKARLSSQSQGTVFMKVAADLESLTDDNTTTEDHNE